MVGTEPSNVEDVDSYAWSGAKIQCASGPKNQNRSNIVDNDRKTFKRSTFFKILKETEQPLSYRASGEAHTGLGIRDLGSGISD